MSLVPSLYVELTDKGMVLGQLQKKGGTFFFSTIEEISFVRFEVKNGIIYNPSFLYVYIREFIEKHRIVDVLTIISIPFISSKNGIKQKLQVLQVGLCCSKAGLRIYKIINTSFLKKVKDE